MEDDARTAAEAVRAAERPLNLAEIATALRRRGGSQTEKQARATVARAEEIGLLRRRGRTRWDTPSEHQPTPADIRKPPPDSGIFVECANRLLDLGNSGEIYSAIKVLLQAASGRPAALRTKQRPVRSTTTPAVVKGPAQNDHREVEVRESALRG